MIHSTFRTRSKDLSQVSPLRPVLPSIASPFALSLLIALAFTLLPATSVRSQTNNRDHLTPPESDLVRDNQELDKRIDVFIRAIERRIAIINGASDLGVAAGNTPAAKKAKKEKAKEDWGEPPKGTRAELLSDIAGLMDEAITNIDNVSLRDPKNPLIGRSVHKLAAAAKGFVAPLEALRSQAKDADELAAIERALENSQEIVEAAKNAPPPAENSNQKKKP
jgi:hypothetical protein